jgi:pyridoxamine 5'-phosphate oxidase
MTGTEQPFYNDLDASLAEVRRLIENGTENRRVPAHHPVVSTIDTDGTPSQRIMILRHVDWAGRQLRFNTDRRTDKAAEIAANPVASVLVYDPDIKIQLRLKGAAAILADGPEVDLAWSQSTLFARRCYMADEAPGSISATPVSGLPDWVEGRKPTDEEIVPARANFAILRFQISSIDWLYLANSGHRCARWHWDSATGDWRGSWLVP